MYSPGSQPIPLDNSGMKSPGHPPQPRTPRSGLKITNPLTNEPVSFQKPAETASPTPGNSTVVPQSPVGASSPASTPRSPSTSSIESGAQETKNRFKELVKQRAIVNAKAEEEEARKKAAEEEAKKKAAAEEAKKKAEDEEKARKEAEEAAAAAKKAEEEAAAAAKKAEEEAAAAKKAAEEPEAPKKDVNEEAIQAALASVNDRIKNVSTSLRCLEKASRLTQEELAKVEYPTGTNKPEVSSSHDNVFIYDIPFLFQFQSVVTFPPKENWDTIRSIMNFEKGSGGNRNFSSRSNSSRGGFQAMGSFGTNFRNGDRSASGPNMGPGGFGMKGMGRMSSSNNLNGMNMHSKSGRQNSSRRGRNDRQGSSRGDRQNTFNNKEKENKEQEEPTPPPAPVAPLVRSANAWVPRTKSAKTEDGKLTPELVQRKVKSLLNKMTLEFFDPISDQLLEISAQSKDEKDGRTLRQVIELTFAKAVDEAHWSNMYARFCAKMLAKIDPEIYDEQIKDPKGNLVKGGALFRKYLLNRCQEEFERGWSDQLPTNEDGSPLDPELMSDEYYAAVAAKRRGLGLIRFIGELYFLGMLTERIMHTCMKLLLNNPEPSEEVVESICQLMTTVGSRLEQNKEHAGMFNAYFQRMKEIESTPGLPSRLRFMLMDVADLRKSGWVDKKKDKGPKTIAEIHEEAKQAKEKAAAAASNHKGRFPKPNGNNNSNRLSRDELDRLKTFKPSSNSFGPSSMSRDGSSRNSSRRSNNSSSSPAVPLSKEPSRQASQRTNAFSILMEDGDKADGN